MSFFLPETPRWLALNGFVDESLQTIADLHSNGNTQAEHVQRTFLEIQEAVIYENNLGKSGWKVMPPYNLCGSLIVSRITSLTLDRHCRKCSPGIANELLLESQCRCSHRLTESTSSPFTFPAHLLPPASMSESPFCTPQLTHCLTLRPQFRLGG